jgi:acetate kinase
VKILVLNAGSSSQKCRLYQLGPSLPETAPAPLWQTEIHWTEASRLASQAGELSSALRKLWTGSGKILAGPREIDAIGHRIVHGGAEFYDPVRLDPQVVEKLARLAELDPLHAPAAIQGIKAVEQILPGVPQCAVFDTAFHHHLPPAAHVYAGPYQWLEEGIRRYGFHGINHQYCAARAAQLLKTEPASLRLISCHLGNGCSLAAIQGGKSVDTTMGFTPLDGIMMGSRPGSLDPGILTFVLRKHGYSADALDEILNHQSGLLGISGVSNDMRVVLDARKQGNARAALAFDIFMHRLGAAIGGMLAALGGLDALLFTAGIGENSAEVREAACQRWAFLGLKLDSARNLAPQGDADIAARDSRVRVLVIHAQEDWAIARTCWKLLSR